MGAKTIVVADADHAAAKSMESLLGNEGYRVVVARNGDEALARAQETRADLVILEILLPEKNGYQVCRTLKAGTATQTIPILFVSAKAQPSDRFWAKRVGGDGFVAKPFDPAGLLREIAGLLQQAETARS